MPGKDGGTQMAHTTGNVTLSGTGSTSNATTLKSFQMGPDLKVVWNLLAVPERNHDSILDFDDIYLWYRVPNSAPARLGSTLNGASSTSMKLNSMKDQIENF